VPGAETLRVALTVARILERLGVPYLVGGSLASSLHGIPRATQDADLVIDLRQPQLEALVAALEQGFYVDLERAREAFESRASFNAIHLATMLKVDFFVLRDEEFHRRQMARRSRMHLGEEAESSVDVASAEDTVIEKLRWYRLGGETSDRQWLDVLGVLKVKETSLDLDYLERWAVDQGVQDLLGRAFQEAGLNPEAPPGGGRSVPGGGSPGGS
jgi:hypothetical protein